ncbi:hypothetical protein FXB38_02575 [Bradyrhizobium cytisi]|uniref:Uncharacterized protein n=1 Tax=Bradyrhizobium cytisi TaxID=515489 RepID=A0A5S4X6G9_9BRAD|nr:hypothetical protein FXB38_02575 [Bradyrhizobium cytisi]
MPKVNSRLSPGVSEPALLCIQLALYLKVDTAEPNPSPKLFAEPTLTRHAPTKYFRLKLIEVKVHHMA